MNTVVVGLQWGDEGKGKIIDILSQRVDYIVRFQGGNNAGHTVVVGDDEFIFHLLPSGILHKGKTCVIGNGVVVNPEVLLHEVNSLKKQKIRVDSRLKISQLSHVILPYHQVLDGLREQKGTYKIGTTKRGIGPCYSDKVARSGIRIIDLLNSKVLKQKLSNNLKEKNEIFKKVYNYKGYSFAKLYKEYQKFGQKLAPFVCDTTKLLNSAIENKKSILFEGAQGTFLDIDFGTYPYVTSSSVNAGGASIGTGVAPTKIDKVIGVIKAYTTRVGEGPFVTEFGPHLMNKIRKQGKEFGATTGRPRRCGWFDAVMARTSVTINDAREIAITKLDVLDILDKISICTGYKYKGKIFKEFPYDQEVIKNAKPVYIQMPGWRKDISSIKKFTDLPLNAKKYVKKIEDLTGAQASIIAVGSKRSQTIFR